MAGSLVEESYEGITVPSGDPEGLTGAAAKWSASAGALERMAGRVDGMPAALSSWRGPASVAFGGATLLASGAARQGVQAFDTAALTARAYASALSDAQDLARQAIGAAIVANGRIRKAQAQIEAAQEREAAAELAAAWAQIRIDATDATGLPLFSGARGDKAAAEGRAEDARADQRRWRKELTEARSDLRAAQKKGRRAETAARAAGVGFSAAAGWVPEIPTLGAPANVSATEAEAITFAVDLRFARGATASNGPARYQPPDVPDGLIGVPRSPEQRAREAPPLDPSTADQSMLATIGLLPILGIPADIAGAIYSAAQGDKKGAGLSLAGIIFEGGDAAKLGRLGTKLAKEGEAATDTARAAKGEGWGRANEGMSPASRAYQIEQGGRAGEVYYKNGVKFDAYENGKLIEAKGDYDQFFKQDGTPKEFWAKSNRGDAGVMDQARRQAGAAPDTPIEWRFKTPQAAEYYAEQFARDRELRSISVKFVPPRG